MILAKITLLLALGSAHAYEGNELTPDAVDAVEEGYEESVPTFVPTQQAPINTPTFVNPTGTQVVNQAGARPATNVEYMPDSPEADENGYVSHEDQLEGVGELEGQE